LQAQLIVYQPTGPYVIKAGKHVGKVLELLMFEDYGWLRWMLQLLNEKSKGEKNELHLHLEWLLARGEDRQPIMLCPHCSQRLVECFSVLYSHGGDFLIGKDFVSCRQCVDRVKDMAIGRQPQILPLRFSVMNHFRSNTDRRRVAGLFRTVFGLPDRLSKQEAFRFFNTTEPCTE